MGNLKISKKAVYKGITYITLTLGLIIVVSSNDLYAEYCIEANGALYEYPPRFFPKIKRNYLGKISKLYSAPKESSETIFINSIFVSTVTVAIAAIVAAAWHSVLRGLNFRDVSFIHVYHADHDHTWDYFDCSPV